MSKKTLLVVDDDEMSRKIIARFLKEEYEILQAENGTEALKILREKPIDALLLDILMPELNGLEVLKIMNDENMLCNTGILVATSTKEKTERQALVLGADDIVSKPYDPVVIKKKIDNVILLKELMASKHANRQAIESSFVDVKADSILKDIRLIQANMDNPELVKELLKRIEEEARSLKA